MSSAKSDKFSYIGNDQPLSHNYSFIGNNNSGVQPNIGGGGGVGGQNRGFSSGVPRQESPMEKLMRERDSDPNIGQPVRRT